MNEKLNEGGGGGSGDGGNDEKGGGGHVGLDRVLQERVCKGDSTAKSEVDVGTLRVVILGLSTSGPLAISWTF